MKRKQWMFTELLNLFSKQPASCTSGEQSVNRSLVFYGAWGFVFANLAALSLLFGFVLVSQHYKIAFCEAYRLQSSNVNNLLLLLEL